MIHTSAGTRLCFTATIGRVFADALEGMVSVNIFFPDRPAAQTETDWTLAELKCARARLKVNKACDNSGLAAEVLQYVPDEFLVELFRPLQWHSATWKCPSRMEKNIVHDASQKDPRKTCDGFPPHCQHTALLQAVCLHDPRTMEQSLETFQPEAQHGFRSGRRMEEHVLTTNLVLDKSGGAGLPLWIISLDLSKAFDTVKWGKHYGKALHRFYSAFITIKQVSFAMVAGASRKFDILSGVRQGCVLSPRCLGRA